MVSHCLAPAWWQPITNAVQTKLITLFWLAVHMHAGKYVSTEPWGQGICSQDPLIFPSPHANHQQVTGRSGSFAEES